MGEIENQRRCRRDFGEALHQESTIDCLKDPKIPNADEKESPK